MPGNRSSVIQGLRGATTTEGRTLFSPLSTKKGDVGAAVSEGSLSSRRNQVEMPEGGLAPWLESPTRLASETAQGSGGWILDVEGFKSGTSIPDAAPSVRCRPPQAVAAVSFVGQIRVGSWNRFEP